MRHDTFSLCKGRACAAWVRQNTKSRRRFSLFGYAPALLGLHDYTLARRVPPSVDRRHRGNKNHLFNPLCGRARRTEKNATEEDDARNIFPYPNSKRTDAHNLKRRWSCWLHASPVGSLERGGLHGRRNTPPVLLTFTHLSPFLITSIPVHNAM